MTERFNSKDREQLSRLLSRILRHTASNEGLVVRSDGFVSVSALLARPKLVKVGADLPRIEQVIQHDPKSRLTLRLEEDGGYWIRANQGHSIPVTELALTPITDPELYPTVLHGTSLDAWRAIRSDEGLRRMNRNHIHLAKGRYGVVKSGVRKNCQVFIYIDLARAMADGIQFFESSNEVILTEGVDGVLDKAYFQRVESADGEILMPSVTATTTHPVSETVTTTTNVPRTITSTDGKNGTANDASTNGQVDGQVDNVTSELSLSTLGTSKIQSLFGDTLSLCMPDSLLDASEIRQVPDSQEVFLDPLDENISLIIEIVESLDPNTTTVTPSTTSTTTPATSTTDSTTGTTGTTGAARTTADAIGRGHFAALASDNEATRHSIQSCDIIHATTLDADIGIRILVTGTQSIAKFNTRDSQDVSIAMGIVRLPKVTTDILITYNAPLNKQEQGRAIVHKAVQSFRVLDWTLFPECC